MSASFGDNVRQHPTHQLNIDDMGDVLEEVLAGGEQGGHLLLEDCILGSKNGNGARERRASGYDKFRHQADVMRLAGFRSTFCRITTLTP